MVEANSLDGHGITATAGANISVGIDANADIRFLRSEFKVIDFNVEKNNRAQARWILRKELKNAAKALRKEQIGQAIGYLEEFKTMMEELAEKGWVDSVQGAGLAAQAGEIAHCLKVSRTRRWEKKEGVSH